MPAMAPVEIVVPPPAAGTGVEVVDMEGPGVMVEVEGEPGVVLGRVSVAVARARPVLVGEVLVVVALPGTGSLPPTALHTIQMSFEPVTLLVAQKGEAVLRLWSGVY
jgi:hypothetical protein